MLRVARKRVVIYYGLNTEFPYIDPLEVLAVLSQSAIIDPPAYLYTKGGKKDVAILTAHKPGYEPQTTDRIMLVKA